MIVTGAFLAEFANVSEQKLNVIGGVLDWFAIPRDRVEPFVVPLTMVVLLQSEAEDDGRADIRIEVLVPESEATVVGSIQVQLPPEADHGFQVAQFMVDVVRTGRHIFILSTPSGDPFTLAITMREID